MKKPAGKNVRRHLDQDEAADWDYAAQSIVPLKRGKARVKPGHVTEFEELPPRPKAGPARSEAPHNSTPTTKHPPLPKRPAPIAEFDRKAAKRLRAGRIEIEGRIDLHGMRQDEAHAALRRFLVRAHARGLRWVLVITGKGKADREGESEDFIFPSRERGVLKRNVPRWLEEPDLRALVISFTSAAIPHGGEGALYVHLRKSL